MQRAPAHRADRRRRVSRLGHFQGAAGASVQKSRRLRRRLRVKRRRRGLQRSKVRTASSSALSRGCSESRCLGLLRLAYAIHSRSAEGRRAIDTHGGTSTRPSAGRPARTASAGQQSRGHGPARRRSQLLDLYGDGALAASSRTDRADPRARRPLRPCMPVQSRLVRELSAHVDCVYAAYIAGELGRHSTTSPRRALSAMHGCLPHHPTQGSAAQCHGCRRFGMDADGAADCRRGRRARRCGHRHAVRPLRGASLLRLARDVAVGASKARWTG